jgi:hypothetical protein
MFQDKVRELKRVKVTELMANSKNWRRHPSKQREMMTDILSEIGFAGAIIAYENNGQMIILDGHLRAELAGDEAEVPVLILDVTEKEADSILATFDKVGTMAEIDQEKVRALYSGLNFTADRLNQLVQAAVAIRAASPPVTPAEIEKIQDAPDPYAGAPVAAKLETICPKCGHEFEITKPAG